LTPNPSPLPPVALDANASAPPLQPLQQLKAAAERRVLALPRFLKPIEQCFFILRKPPAMLAVPDAFLLLPPGKTWGNLPFTAFNLTDQDFDMGESALAPSGPDELIVDFELAGEGSGSGIQRF